MAALDLSCSTQDLGSLVAVCGIYAGRDWGQEEQGTTEDEMAGWHHRLNGLESEQTPGDSEAQGSLACCS